MKLRKRRSADEGNVRTKGRWIKPDKAMMMMMMMMMMRSEKWRRDDNFHQRSSTLPATY
jgi:hypothetical protein